MRFFLLNFLFLSLFSCTTDNNQSSDASDSVSDISELIDNDILNDSLYFERALINFSKRRYHASIKDLRQSILLDSTNSDSHYLLGDILFIMLKQRDGDASSIIESEQSFYRSIKFGFSDSLHAYQRLGEINLYKKDYDESIYLLNKSLNIGEDNYTYILLSYAYMSLGDYDMAIESCHNSIEIDPRNKEALLNLGNIYAQKFDMKGIEYYDLVLSIDPLDRIAHYNKGILYQNNLMYSEAQEAYHKLFEDGVEDKFYVDANYNLGFIFMEDLKDYRNAINYFADAIRVNPNHAYAYFSMGLCYQSLGDVVHAEKYYKRCLEIHPDNKDAQNNLNQLLIDNEKYK